MLGRNVDSTSWSYNAPGLRDHSVLSEKWGYPPLRSAENLDAQAFRKPRISGFEYV